MERSRANKNRFKLRSTFRQTETKTSAPEEPTVMDRFMSMGKTLGNSKAKPYAKIDIASKYTFKPVSEEELEKKQGKSAERKAEKGTIRAYKKHLKGKISDDEFVDKVEDLKKLQEKYPKK